MLIKTVDKQLGREEGASEKLIEYYTNLYDFHFLIVKAFKEAGVPMVAGTDAGISGVIWGFSLHNELKLLVEAGLTNEEALASATRLGAEWLEIDDKIGTIETGKFADLILLISFNCSSNSIESLYW